MISTLSWERAAPSSANPCPYWRRLGTCLRCPMAVPMTSSPIRLCTQPSPGLSEPGQGWRRYLMQYWTFSGKLVIIVSLPVHWKSGVCLMPMCRQCWHLRPQKSTMMPLWRLSVCSVYVRTYCVLKVYIWHPSIYCWYTYLLAPNEKLAKFRYNFCIISWHI